MNDNRLINDRHQACLGYSTTDTKRALGIKRQMQGVLEIFNDRR